MKAIGKYLLIEKVKESITKTKGGLILSQSQKDDIRYVEAIVKTVGNEVLIIKKDDVILYDKNAGHRVSGFDDSILIIHVQNIVAIL